MCLFAFFALCQAACCAGQVRQAISSQGPSKVRRSIGLVLEGGGALGFAHVGVLRWLFEHHIPVDSIAGTSMGALVGSMIAAGYTPEDIEKIASNANFEDMFAVREPLEDLSFRRREDRDAMPHAVALGLRGGGVSLSTGLITDTRLNGFLVSVLLPYNADELSFDDLPIPFRCVATDLTALRPRVFASGSLPSAVRASISIPGVFSPVVDGGDLLVDGAIMDNLPTDVSRREEHADIVVAVHLQDATFAAKDATSPAAIFARALQAGTSRNEEISRKLADIEILPDVQSFSSTDYNKLSALEQAGYAAAERRSETLLPYALNGESWRNYRAGILARRRPSPDRITQVQVEGPDPRISARLTQEAHSLLQPHLQPSQAETFLAHVRSDGALDATYSFLHSGVYTDRSGTARSEADDSIALRWRRSADGPPYLLFGADVIAMNSNVTRTIFDLRFVDQNLIDLGSELRVDAGLGYLTRVNASFSQPIRGTRFFVEPRSLFLRQPVYLWQNQQRVSERRLERAGGGFQVGFTENHNLQFALAYSASTLHWTTQEGVDNSPTPALSGSTQSVAAHVTYSNRTAEIAAPHGTRVDLSIGRLLQTTDSPDSNFLLVSMSQTYTLSRNNLLSFAGEASTYFRSHVPDPLRFTLGGPLRLYASSIDEYRGTDVLFGRAAYLRRLATLPTGVGQGVYLAGGVEAGNVWSPEQRAILRRDGFGGVLLSTPLGAITLGAAVGDAGRRKVFLTFGKLF